MKNKEWWQTSFGRNYLETYVDVLTSDRTANELKFIFRTLKLPRGARILDIGCGFGRHSIPLGERGYLVTGIDYSPLFIRLAKLRADDLGISNVHFLKQDMRTLRIKNAVDAAICMFTSFGYFRSDADNEKVIARVSNVLKKGGVFLLDMNNPFRIAKLFKYTASVTQVRELSSGITVKTVQRYDARTKRWKMTRRWGRDAKWDKYRTNVRLYTSHEMANLLKKNGLGVIKTFGDYDSSAYTKNSPRLIVLAKKN